MFLMFLIPLRTNVALLASKGERKQTGFLHRKLARITIRCLGKNSMVSWICAHQLTTRGQSCCAIGFTQHHVERLGQYVVIGVTCLESLDTASLLGCSIDKPFIVCCSDSMTRQSLYGVGLPATVQYMYVLWRARDDRSSCSFSGVGEVWIVMINHGGNTSTL